MGRRRYSLDIFARGVVSTTATPAYTLGTSYFRDAPILGGQIIRAAQCQVESNPYRITLVDVGSTFTAKIGDSSGRLHLLGRLCRIKSSLDSTALTSLGVGRLTDLAMNQDVASWDLDISDERWIERQTDIFTKSNTMSIVPYGPINAFQGVPAIPTVKWRCIQKTGNMVCLRYDGNLPVPTTPDIANLIVHDQKVGSISGNSAITSGNFTTLRFKNSATDYEIGAFGFDVFLPGGRPRYPTHGILGFWNDPVLLGGNDHTGTYGKLYVWLVWTAGTPSLDSDVSGYLYAPTHEPTDALPQLVGGTTGLHPGRLTRNAYAGTYSATTSLTVRASTAAFDRWENEPAYGRVWFRIPAPINMADFLDERIYGPYNVAPVVDSSGKISPTRMWLPTSTQLNVAGLASLTSTNLLTHPTFEQPSREAVTAIRYTYEGYGGNGFQWAAGNVPTYYLPKPTTMGSTFIHDTLTLLGRRQLTFKLGSVSMPTEFVVSTAAGVPFGLPGYIGNVFSKWANSLFQRFGDGPLYSQAECTSAIDATTNGAILPGAFVKLTLGTYPNPGTLARSGTLLFQVLRRDVTPRGRAFVLLNAGANLTPVAGVTVALALSSMSSRHAIKATVASLAAGARYEVQIAHSTSTGAGSAPAANSARWFIGSEGTTASLATVIGQRPSKTKIFARARASKPNKIGSAWSTATISVVTASITGPSAFSVGSLTAGSGLAKWTNGSSIYGTEIMVDQTSNATLGSTNAIAKVPPQTTRYNLLGLKSNNRHKGGVRHYDAFGGRSTQSNNTFLTTTSYTAAPSLLGIGLVEGK